MSRWCRWERTPGLIDFPIEDDRTIVGRHVIDVTDRSNPSILGELPLSHPVVAKVKDNLAFVTTTIDGVDKLLIYDIAPVVEATVDFDPDTLNLKSKGKWVTCYIELPEDYDVEHIDVSTVKLWHGEANVSAEWGDVQDGALMVKFDRSDVQDMLDPGDEVEVTVSGKLTDETPFEGTDTIRVIE